MYEYALLKNGSVVSISTRSVPMKSEELVKYSLDANGYCPLLAVPIMVLEKYIYWNERP